MNLLRSKGHEVLTVVKTIKFGDVTCAKYKSVTPHSCYAGSDQGCSTKEKKIEDLLDIIYTLEKGIDEEHVYRKSLQHDLNALNHFVAKMKK